MDYCKIESCKRNVRANGYCAYHNHRQWQGFDIIKDKPPENNVELIEYIKRNFHYDLRTGNLWRHHDTFCGLLQAKCGTSGYMHCTINKKQIKLHTIVWILHNGTFPDGNIDHRNRIRTDNRIENLRLANDAENSYNRSTGANNSSGFKGVHMHSSGNYWIAQLQHYHLGCFKLDQKEEAARAYDAAAIKYYGEFARLNFPKQSYFAWLT